jgi:DMSO/TMAO reductase YedYZ molybdopterin-dependent catalytic subunit
MDIIARDQAMIALSERPPLSRVAGVAAFCVALAALVPVPAHAQPSTAVAMAGNVAEAKTLTVDELKRLPPHRVEYAPRRGGEPASEPAAARHYTGALLRDVLNAAKPTESKPRELRRSYVVAAASDGYEVVFSWGELFLSQGDSVFVVYERDGAPLGDDEGKIALVAAGDRGSARHVKWLRTLTLRSAS